MWIKAQRKYEVNNSLINLDMVSTFDVDDDDQLIATMKDGSVYLVSNHADMLDPLKRTQLDTLIDAIKEGWPVFYGRLEQK